MSKSTKVHNFSAGPGILPQEVIKQAAEATINFANRNLSILEVSHRSKEMVEVLEEARALAKELLGFGDEYETLFLGGGASTQFLYVAYNLLNEDDTAHYLDTGTWSTKAIKEAKLLGNVNVVASSKDKNFTYIPKVEELPTSGAYYHITSNNTIYGTQLQEFPETSIPLVCDMSSDIFSRPIPAKNFALVYAGAQKNMGPAGTTLVIIRKDILGKVKRALPSMIDYELQISKKSSFNTPPVFPIYVSLLTMRWIKANGGVEAMEVRNKAKADLLYGEIDRNPLFQGTTAVEDRSKMNVTFNVTKEELLDEFFAMAKEHNLDALKGHRSVGGIRASIYNAMDIESVQALVDMMQAFEKKFG